MSQHQPWQKAGALPRATSDSAHTACCRGSYPTPIQLSTPVVVLSCFCRPKTLPWIILIFVVRQPVSKNMDACFRKDGHIISRTPTSLWAVLMYIHDRGNHRQHQSRQPLPLSRPILALGAGTAAFGICKPCRLGMEDDVHAVSHVPFWRAPFGRAPSPPSPDPSPSDAGHACLPAAKSTAQHSVEQRRQQTPRGGEYGDQQAD